MALSNDNDLLDYVPDLESFGIEDFADDHARAEADIYRQLRAGWFVKTGYSGEMDSTLLTQTQLTRLGVYRVLGWYVFPKLTKWSDEQDRFEKQMNHYRGEYANEFEAVLRDGVEYDANEDDTVSDSEKAPVHHGRLVR